MQRVRVTCSFCGLPFSVRTAQADAQHFCCSGCALASRIFARDSGTPLTRELIIALVLGFGLFNQCLFALLAANTAKANYEASSTFAVISIAIGTFEFVAGIACVLVAKSRRATDVAVSALAILPAIMAARSASVGEVRSSAWLLLIGNLCGALWVLRGWFRRAWRHTLRQ